MGDFAKTNIQVTPGVRGSVSVLGGDVLAIPTGLPQERKERAIELIKHLIAKETQRKLAKNLYWVPVRGDVYDELSAPEEKKYFEVIQKALETAVMRPITPNGGPVEAILSEALQSVLAQSRALKASATDPQIDALLRPFIANLQASRASIWPVQWYHRRPRARKVVKCRCREK